MARRSARLRHTDLKSLYQIVGECCELGADSLLWRAHLLDRLNKHFYAVSSIFVNASFDASAPGVGSRVLSVVSVDQYTVSERKIVSDCLKSMPLEDNPLGPRLAGEARPQSVAVANRNRLVGRDEWEQSRCYTRYFRPLGWYDILVGILPGQNDMQCLCLARTSTDADFCDGDALFVKTLLTDLTSISPQRLARWSGDSLALLPLRERQVLLALAEGDEEKQIALRLKISRNTVHEYVKRLFKRYNVTSRSTLMVKAARQIHAHHISTASHQMWFSK